MRNLAAGTPDFELACPISATIRRNPGRRQAEVSGGRGGERGGPRSVLRRLPIGISTHRDLARGGHSHAGFPSGSRPTGTRPRRPFPPWDEDEDDAPRWRASRESGRIVALDSPYARRQTRGTIGRDALAAWIHRRRRCRGGSRRGARRARGTRVRRCRERGAVNPRRRAGGAHRGQPPVSQRQMDPAGLLAGRRGARQQAGAVRRDPGLRRLACVPASDLRRRAREPLRGARGGQQHRRRLGGEPGICGRGAVRAADHGARPHRLWRGEVGDGRRLRQGVLSERDVRVDRRRRRPVVPAVQSVPEPERSLDHCIVANARVQAHALSIRGPVLPPAIRSGALRIVSAVYEIASGRVVLV